METETTTTIPEMVATEMAIEKTTTTPETELTIEMAVETPEESTEEAETTPRIKPKSMRERQIEITSNKRREKRDLPRWKKSSQSLPHTSNWATIKEEMPSSLP